MKRIGAPIVSYQEGRLPTAEVLRMTIVERLRVLAQKSDELARAATNENIRDRLLEIAASYRRLADREEFLEANPLSKSKAHAE